MATPSEPSTSGVIAPLGASGPPLAEPALDLLGERVRDLVVVLRAELTPALDRVTQIVAGHEIAHGRIVRLRKRACNLL